VAAQTEPLKKSKGKSEAMIIAPLLPFISGANTKSDLSIPQDQ
jgi:hypothetical protein